jgi:XTP/dITP diphosphohydrolase
MQKLLIATTNQGKLKEFKNFLSDIPLELVSLIDLGISQDFEENGKTYEENSEGKARFYAELSGLPTLSDDGGIEIVALNNEPGIKSRRWLGYEATDKELINHMIKVSKELQDNNRTAFFRTVVSVILPDGSLLQERGEVKGIIAKKPFLKLNKGYPYRSFFFIPEIERYYHESDLSEEQQKLYNHRYKTVQKLKPQLLQKLKIQ